MKSSKISLGNATVLQLDMKKEYPNGEKIKYCEKCNKKIPFMDKALQSTTRIDTWCCLRCFAKQIQSQMEKKIPLKEIEQQILDAGVKK